MTELSKNLKTILKEYMKTEPNIQQALMDIGYDFWQKEENQNLNYSDILTRIIMGAGFSESDGHLIVFAILTGKYNQQVENGGHIQYFNNGYATKNSNGCWGNYDDISLHEYMIYLVKNYGFEDEPVLKVMEKVSLIPDYCNCCDGAGYYENYFGDENEDDRGECDECDGTGESESVFTIYNHEILNDEYYKINEKWLETLNSFFTERLIS